jgi:hypothetical protein
MGQFIVANLVVPAIVTYVPSVQPEQRLENPAAWMSTAVSAPQSRTASTRGRDECRAAL